jgi:hypothetical protein
MFQPVQVNPCLHDLHHGNNGTDIPAYLVNPQSQLQGVQPSVLQITQVSTASAVCSLMAYATMLYAVPRLE